MIVVDSSVWIAYLRGSDTVQTGVLEASNPSDIIVGDLVLTEVLQGARNDRHADRLERRMRSFAIAAMVDARIAVAAAANFRLLRTRGVTIRKTIDMLIGTFCILHGHELLHDDRDFEPMARHLGLRAVTAGPPPVR